MTRFLTNSNKATLLAELQERGFEWPGEPQLFQQVTNGLDWAIWLGNIPLQDATFDEEGNVVTPQVMSTDFHVNTTDCVGIEFPSELSEPPSKPYNLFA